MTNSASPLQHACPTCNAGPGEPCKNRTRSYRRGSPLERPHRARVDWARAITGGQVLRVPVMLSENDVVSILHAIYETGVCERPSPNTMTKLRTALRRVNPDLDPDTLEPRRDLPLTPHSGDSQ